MGPIGMLAWDVGAPLAAYYGLRLAGADERWALLAGALLAAGRLAWTAARRRQVDGVAGLLATILAVSLLLSFVTGDVRTLLLKDSAATAAAGLVLLLSRTPLVLTAVRATSTPSKRAEIDRLHAESPGFRRALIRVSKVWGLGLLADAVVRLPLVYLLPVDWVPVASLVLLLAVITALCVWTAWYADQAQSRHGARVDQQRLGPDDGAIDVNTSASRP
ncbi:VC0807 family protein [Actinokineospora pegani]|uniref:VC0807 family protein n=1 Tax=Actinokineospora pegani TaxID=2654637 RepID=UPI0018D41FB1|nr:VC0807 family protein [Actinokineospora pegani]